MRSVYHLLIKLQADMNHQIVYEKVIHDKHNDIADYVSKKLHEIITQYLKIEDYNKELQKLNSKSEVNVCL